MEVAPEPIDVARRERGFGWASLVGVVARVPLPIRAKQLVGSLVVAALLALVAVLGLVALGQSNSRGTELRRLQQQGVYEQLLLTDATQLKQLLDYRVAASNNRRSNEAPLRSDEPDLPISIPPPTSAGSSRLWISRSATRSTGSASTRAPEWTACSTGVRPAARCRSPSRPSLRRCTGSSRPLTRPLWRPRVTAVPPDAAFNALFFCVTGASGTPQGPIVRSSSVPTTGRLRSRRSSPSSPGRPGPARTRSSRPTGARTASSRNLLIGAGAGSLLLALALGLLLVRLGRRAAADDAEDGWRDRGRRLLGSRGGPEPRRDRRARRRREPDERRAAARCTRSWRRRAGTSRTSSPRCRTSCARR